MPRVPQLINRIIKSRLSLEDPPVLSRRAFIHTGSQLLIATGTIQLLSGYRSHNPPVIAIVGAGLAGLTAAYYLEKAGLTAKIFEAQSRVGGRIVSVNNLIAAGITTELGGEFIDSAHSDILKFCKEFRLPLLDMKAASETELVRTDYSFSGRRISENEIINEFRNYASRTKRDIDELPENLDPTNPKVIRLDNLSIDEYLHDIGMTGWLFDLISTSFTSELGIPSGDQSSLNMLVSLNTHTSKGFEIYGDSDERYKVTGGNERITAELRNRLKSEVKTGHQLKRISTQGAGYKLSFDNGQEIKADLVIMTIPFSVLRDVEIKVDMPQRKRDCIDKLGYGMQSKLFIGIDQRIWRDQGYSGYVLSDQIHNGWDSSQMQQDNTGPGGYSLFLGADKGRNLTLSQYNHYLAECDKVFPGMQQAANGRKSLYNWNQNPMTRGAYACYKVGQVSGIGKAEVQTVGNMFFAGEHCSDNFQGFMNGAAETGRKAAEDIIKKLGAITKKQASH